MRVTMGMTSNTYYKNLNKNYEQLLRAEMQRTTFRKFEEASEDPISSMKAYRYRQEISENNSYQSNVSFLKDTISSQLSAITDIRSVTSQIADTELNKLLNDPMGKNEENRQAIATTLRSLQAAIVAGANIKFGGNYLFGGAGTAEAPFTVDASGNLLYRGIDVNTGAIAAGTTTNINGVTITLGDKAGTYNGYTIQIANGIAANPVAINNTAKTITVTLDLSHDPKKTNEDLLNALKSTTEFANASMTGDTFRPVTAEPPFVDYNGARIILGNGATYDNYTINIVDGGFGSMDSISVTGNTVTVSMDLSNGKTNQDLLNLLRSTTEFANASISGNASNVISSATNITAKAVMTTTACFDNAQLDLGDTTGKYNGYTLKLANGANSVTIDDTNKEITVSLNINSNTTAEDVLKVLKSNSEFSKASMSGNLSTKVTDGTAVTLTSSNLPTSIATNTIGQAGLKALANEKSYVDIGAGLSFDADGNINSQNVFNVSLPGISLLGYGTADGTGTDMSNNIYTLIGQIADILESDSYSQEKIKPYIDQFRKQTELLSTASTQAGTNKKFLETTEQRLISIGDNAADALDLAANVDTVDAYLNYMNQYYAYQSALQVGTKLLQSTILDYMR